MTILYDALSFSKANLLQIKEKKHSPSGQLRPDRFWHFGSEKTCIH